MAQKVVKVTLQAVTSKFHSAMKAVGAQIRRVGQAARAVAGRVAGMAKNMVIGTAKMLGLASAGMALYAVFTTLKGIVSLGAELSHLSDQTGVAAGQLLILRQAFEDAGVNGSMLGKTVNKMQKAIVDATGPAPLLTYQRAFKRIGLEAEDLKKLKPADQFEAIAKALRGTKDVATRTASAMEIFGKAGPAMMPLIMDENAVADAKKALGGMPDDMDRLADTLERVDTLIGRFKMKLQQAFLPIVEKFLPKILEWLEKMNAQDFGEWGKKIANALGTMFNIIKAGKGPQMFADMLIIGFMKFMQAIVPLFSAFAQMLGNMMLAIMAPMFASIMKLNPANAGKSQEELEQEFIDRGSTNLAEGAKKGEDAMKTALGNAQLAPMARLMMLFFKHRDKDDPEKKPKDKVDKKPWMVEEDAVAETDFGNFRASVGDSLASVGGGGGAFGGTSGFWELVEKEKEAQAQRNKLIQLQEQALEALKEGKGEEGEAPMVEANAA